MITKKLGAGMLGLFLAAAVVSGGATVVQAATSSSSVGYHTSGGVQYFNRADVDNTNKRAATTTGRADNAVMASGRAGSQGRLFLSSGTLCTQGAMTYNNGGTFAQGRTSTTCGPQAHYSYGVSNSWNGSGYDAWYTYRSPSLNF